MRFRLTALVAFALYVAASFVLGEVYPVYQFTMYSRPVDVRAVAAPWFAAGGQRADADDFACFTGVDASLLAPPEYPHSTRYIWHDWRRWATTRSGASAGATVPVEFGYVLLTLSEAGVEISDPIVQTSGMACRR